MEDVYTFIILRHCLVGERKNATPNSLSDSNALPQKQLGLPCPGLPFLLFFLPPKLESFLLVDTFLGAVVEFIETRTLIYIDLAYEVILQP